jgi:hypothetical protein
VRHFRNRLELQRRLPQLLNFVLLAAIGATLVGGVRVLRPGATTPATVPAAPVALAQRTPEPSIERILGAQLFGSAAADAEVAAAVPLDDPSLRLLGILQDRRTDGSRALIADGDGGEEQTFAPGDEVQPGLVLEQIHERHVLLRRREKRYELRLNPEDAPSTVPERGIEDVEMVEQMEQEEVQEEVQEDVPEEQPEPAQSVDDGQVEND